VLQELKKSNQDFTDDKETAAGLLKQVEGWELRDVSRFCVFLGKGREASGLRAKG